MFIIFLSLFFQMASFIPALASDSTSASLLANRISFLSAHGAKEYLPLYQKVFTDCIGDQKLSKIEKRNCLDRAVKAVEEASAPRFATRILRDRISELRTSGHLSTYVIYPDLNKQTLGVVGDSLAVGAMAAEHLNPHFFSLVGSAIFDFMLMNQNTTRQDESPLITDQTTSSRVLRVFDTPESRKSGLSRYYENKGSRFLDCEECSFAYTYGRYLGLPSSNIIFAGQSGKRVDSLKDQLFRLALPIGHLPETVIISYTANDFCHSANALIAPEEKYREYYQTLTNILKGTLSKLKPAPTGTKLIVIAAADVGNLLRNEKILSKELRHYFPGGPNKDKVTCGDIRRQEVGGAKEIAGMCEYILGTRPGDVARIDHIVSLNQAVVRAQKEAVKYMKARHPIKGFSFYFSDSIRNIEFDADDISPDCFHPSSKGHDKIAESLMQSIRAH